MWYIFSTMFKEFLKVWQFMYGNAKANSFIIFIVHIEVEYCVANLKLCTNFFSSLHE